MGLNALVVWELKGSAKYFSREVEVARFSADKPSELIAGGK